MCSEIICHSVVRGIYYVVMFREAIKAIILQRSTVPEHDTECVTLTLRIGVRFHKHSFDATKLLFDYYYYYDYMNWS